MSVSSKTLLLPKGKPQGYRGIWSSPLRSVNILPICLNKQSKWPGPTKWKLCTAIENTAIEAVSSMVHEDQKLLHQTIADSYAELRLEIQRWRDILAVPYAQYKSMLLPSKTYIVEDSLI